MLIYTVKAGDTLTSIAKLHGINSGQSLYDDPANKTLRAKRPNPNLILPGDKISIPTVGQIAKYKMCVIDGTGPSDTGEYTPAMRNSFCNQLAAKFEVDGKYIRGPGALGLETLNAAKEARNWIYASRNEPGVKFMLAGYSRGGSAAIMAAESLEKDGIPIDSMFLFDAVARHHYTGGEVIPANVEFSCHAVRDLNALMMILKYEGSFADHKLLPNASNPMRPTFGNTGITWRGNGKEEDHLLKSFRGSHGALGGVGWAFVHEDLACQNEVANWMNQRLRDRKVTVQIESLGVTGDERGIPTASTWLTGVALDALLIAKHKWNLSRAGNVPK